MLFVLPVLAVNAPIPGNEILLHEEKSGMRIRTFLALRSETEKQINVTTPIGAVLNATISSATAGILSFSFLSEHLGDLPFRISRDLTDQLILDAGRYVFRLEPHSTTALPSVGDQKWYSPILLKNRRSYEQLFPLIRSPFGSPRSSYGRKHLHAGIDIGFPYGEAVYPIAEGKVLFISNLPNEGTVVLEHRLPGDRRVFSKYVHVAEISVAGGEIVTPQAHFARALKENEFKRSGLPFNHVHLEIRKNFSDEGINSSSAKTRSDLELNLYDPAKYLKERFD